jgi:hypothetical protein
MHRSQLPDAAACPAGRLVSAGMGLWGLLLDGAITVLARRDVAHDMLGTCPRLGSRSSS